MNVSRAQRVGFGLSALAGESELERRTGEANTKLSEGRVDRCMNAGCDQASR